MDDLVGAGKALEKLIGAIQAGTGVLYKPRAIRKEAEAEAYKTKLIGEAQAEVEAAKVVALAKAEASAKIISAEVEQDLIERMQMRIFQKEVNRQQNIESISEIAIKELPKDVSDEPVDKDWLTRYFNIAEDVSEEEMQKVWGKLLAGEVSQPGSYSIRTLEVLKNLNQYEATVFQKFCQFTFSEFVYDNKELLEKHGIQFNDIMLLRAAGLLLNMDDIVVASVKEGKKYKYQGIKCIFLNFTKLHVMPLSLEGIQLKELIEPLPNFEYVRDLAKALKKEGGDFKKIITSNNGGIVSEKYVDF